MLIPLALLLTLCGARWKGVLYAKDATGRFIVDVHGTRQPDGRMALLASMYEPFRPGAFAY